VPARLVLQPSERDVVARTPKTERDPGERLVPLGLGLHLHVDKADRAQRRGPVDAQAARQPGIFRGPQLPAVQHQTMTGPHDVQDLAARRREVGGEVEGVDGDDGVGDGSGQPGRGEVADDKRAVSASPNSAARSLAC
jgi:hypothetical protein